MSVLALLIDANRRLSKPAATSPTLVRRWASWPGEQLSYRRAYFTVRRLSPHMIADMGLDPDDLPASFRKKWHAPGKTEVVDGPQTVAVAAGASARRRTDSNPVVMTERADACACS